MIRKTLAVSVAAAMLTACGGSSSNSGVTTPTPQPPTPTPEPVTVVPEINSSRAIAGSLVQPGQDAFSRYLKNGIYGMSSSTVRNTMAMPTAAPVNEAADSASSTGSDGGFSQTNTAEIGVDEADRVEYDGDFMYVATQPVWYQEDGKKAGVRVLQRADDFSLSEVNRLEVESENNNINGMYLHGDNLSVVSSGYPMMPLMEIATTMFAPGNFTNQVDINLYDVTSPVDAKDSTDIAIDGWLITSRRIDNNLYIVSSYSPNVDLPHAYAEDKDQELANYEYLQALNTEELMPTITINGATSTMNQPEDCFIPEGATEADGHGQVLTITRINMQQPDDVQSVCMSAYADTSYMSTESLYLTAYTETGTALHKVDVAESFTYVASGEVSGYTNGDVMRMSESDGYFRIVTTDWNFRNEDGPDHNLFVLQQQGTELVTVAQLPNEQQPAKIGKPNEDIYAVRFIQDKAYIVTFERTDPLYVIDLSDNAAPSIAGELEIPGFSSYLHPMENGYLLGVGQEVSLQTVNNVAPVDGEEPATFPVNTGAKISLFDVSDPSNPIEISNVSFDDAYTPVEYDYRALSVLKNGDQYQFAMPLEAWKVEEVVDLPEIPSGEGESSSEDDTSKDDGETGDNDTETTDNDNGDEPLSTTNHYYQQNSLLMFNVNAASGAGSMEVVNQMIVEPNVDYSWSGDDRSVIHGENVYFIQGNRVFHSLWQAAAPVNGPF